MSECSICLTKIENDDGSITCCCHKYHTSCIMQWLEFKKTCPMCRCSLDTFQLFPLIEKPVPVEEKNHKDNIMAETERKLQIKQNIKKFIQNAKNTRRPVKIKKYIAKEEIKKSREKTKAEKIKHDPNRWCEFPGTNIFKL